MSFPTVSNRIAYISCRLQMMVALLTYNLHHPSGAEYWRISVPVVCFVKIRAGCGSLIICFHLGKKYKEITGIYPDSVVVWQKQGIIITLYGVIDEAHDCITLTRSRLHPKLCTHPKNVLLCLQL